MQGRGTAKFEGRKMIWCECELYSIKGVAGKLGQCKARPFSFHRVFLFVCLFVCLFLSFFVSLFLSLFFSTPTQNVTCQLVIISDHDGTQYAVVGLCVFFCFFVSLFLSASLLCPNCTGRYLPANVYRIFDTDMHQHKQER